MLPIKETFVSVQGEGYYAGTPSFFIRTQGCDIGCHWCDEPNSWDLNAGTSISLDHLVSKAKSNSIKNIIFTGGEPLMHDLTEISSLLSKEGFVIHLETSGAYPISGVWDWVTLSPKKIKPPLPEMYQYASELKIIIYNKHDFQWALEEAEKVSDSCLLYIQPEWSKKTVVQPLILDFLSKQKKWKLSLQMHKYLNIK